jgi:hypothetical protein
MLWSPPVAAGEKGLFVRLFTACWRAIAAPLFVLMLGVVGVPDGLPGQSKTTAAVRGVVEDASAGRIAGAKIVLRNRDTNARWETSSNASGVYQFPLVTPGIYRMEVTKESFGEWRREGLELTVGQEATVEVRLAVAGSNFTAEVAADVPLLEPQRTQQSNTLSREEVRNLPIGRRDYLTFSLLAPGVADSKGLADANSFRVKQTPDSGLSFYGSNGRGNAVNVDGGEANDPGGGVRPTVSQEAVLEFQVNRSNYSAEHGAARGGIINIVTRSGTNAVHGSLFAFFRQQSMDATDPFAVNLEGGVLRRVKPKADQQQFGATVGGGALVKDRTFYFLSYEQLRRREARTGAGVDGFVDFWSDAGAGGHLRPAAGGGGGAVAGALSTPGGGTRDVPAEQRDFPLRDGRPEGFVPAGPTAFGQPFVDISLQRDGDLRYQRRGGSVGGSFARVCAGFSGPHGVVGWTYTRSAQTVNEFRGQYNYYGLRTESTDPFGPALEIAGFGLFNRDRLLAVEYAGAADGVER